MKPKNWVYVGGPPLDPPDEPEVCDTCGGHGEIWIGTYTYHGHWEPPEPDMEVCPECGGLTDAERRQKAFDDFDPPDAEFGE